MNEIIYLKMQNGEDVVATVVKETSTDIAITNPLTMKMIHTNGQTMGGLFPWAPIVSLLNCIYTINKNNIMAYVQAPDAIKTHYDEIIKIAHEQTDDDEEEETGEEDDDEDFPLKQSRSNTSITLH